MDSKRGTICSRHTVKDIIEGCELAVETEDSGIETLICIICFQLNILGVYYYLYNLIVKQSIVMVQLLSEFLMLRNQKKERILYCYPVCSYSTVTIQYLYIDSGDF